MESNKEQMANEIEESLIEGVPMFDGENFGFKDPRNFLTEISSVVISTPSIYGYEIVRQRTTGFAKIWVEDRIENINLGGKKEFFLKYEKKILDEAIMEEFEKMFCPPEHFRLAELELSGRLQDPSKSTKSYTRTIIRMVDEYEGDLTLKLIGEIQARGFKNVYSYKKWNLLLKKHLILEGLDENLHPWKKNVPKSADLIDVIKRINDEDEREDDYDGILPRKRSYGFLPFDGNYNAKPQESHIQSNENKEKVESQKADNEESEQRKDESLPEKMDDIEDKRQEGGSPLEEAHEVNNENREDDENPKEDSPNNSGGEDIIIQIRIIRRKRK